MSTIEDFENAPIGAIATNKHGRKAVKTFDTDNLPWYGDDYVWRSAEHMSWHHFTLDPARTTAQEALDLAWELAHPIKEGQKVEIGTELIVKVNGDFRTYRAKNTFEGPTGQDWAEVRTLAPLPDPTPDWLDAPAVLAVCNEVMDRAVFVRQGDNWWASKNYAAATHQLREVTGLFPKEQDAREGDRQMRDRRKLWLDTRGVPVITTAVNGERNAERWGWTPATAVPTEEEKEMSTTPPTTAREALDLAWELAYPIKEGQDIPVGTWLIERRDNEIIVGKNGYFNITASEWDAENLRTLDPLPDPEPEWLDAPAVLAHTDNDDTRRVWTARRDEQWASTSHTYTRHWRDLRDVTPLYPKEDA